MAYGLAILEHRKTQRGYKLPNLPAYLGGTDPILRANSREYHLPVFCRFGDSVDLIIGFPMSTVF